MKTLYDTDYDAWYEEQIENLRQGNLDALDIPHLIEELEALVRGEKSAVENFAYQIILHLLLIDYWYEESEWNRRYWRSEIDSFQFQLNNRLTTNLKMHLSSRLDFIYSKARKNAISKTGLSNRFPEQSPYNLSQILDKN
jgi:hypothetical protein